MIFSPTVAEWVAAYEQKLGRKPSETALQITKHIETIGGMLREIGHADAQVECEAYQLETFLALASEVFRNLAHEATQEIAELWLSDYLDGYQEGGPT